MTLQIVSPRSNGSHVDFDELLVEIASHEIEVNHEVAELIGEMASQCPESAFSFRFATSAEFAEWFAQRSEFVETFVLDGQIAYFFWFECNFENANPHRFCGCD